MRTLKILALSATLVVATAGLALAGGACDGKAKAESASAKAACSSTAAVQTASATGGCASGASAQTAGVKAEVAGAGCASGAVKTADAAGAGCSAEKAAMAKAIKVETVRMPSGAMAVFYSGSCEKSTAFLQASAEGGCQGFACDLAKAIAADQNCTVEMAKTQHGVMMLVTSPKAEVVDGYAAKYAAVLAQADTQGE